MLCVFLSCARAIVVKEEKANQFRIVSIGWRQKDWRQSATDVWHDDISKISSSSSSLFFVFFQKNIYFSCCVGHQQQHEMGHPIDYRLRVTFNSFPSTLYSRQEGRGYSIYIDLLFNLYIHSSSSVICSQKRSSNLFFCLS